MHMLPLLLTLAGCGDPPTIKVQVTDVWNKPLADATVVKEGVTERFHTATDGVVRIPVEAGRAHFMAGHEGYIKELATIEVGEDVKASSPLKIQLYPEPDTVGFYGVGDNGYIPLQPAPITAVATENSTVHGVKNIPEAILTASHQPLRFVFTSTLRAQQLKQQNLTLSRLSFKERESLLGVLGTTEIALNLWVADQDVPFDVRGLQSQDDYLLIIQDKLPEGVYAFHAQKILDPSAASSLEKLPKEMQVAYIFEIK